MATPKATGLPEFDMFLRLWDQRKMTRALARELLKLDFSPDDDERMHALAVKNQDGEITPGELRELDAYIRTGTMLSILQSRARTLLKSEVPAQAGGRRSR